MELIAEKYKQTDIGLIPIDWKVVELNTLVDNNRSIRYGIVQPGKYDPNGRFMVRGQDYSFGWVDTNEMFRVSPEVEIRYRNARLIGGDVILTIVGAGTGTMEIVPHSLNGSNITQTTARIAIDSNKANAKYCKYYFQSAAGKNQINLFIKGAAQPGLNIRDVKIFKLTLPPTKAEQTAIATALSDADNYISSLEKLVAKKRLIKQGAMQQLLTPKENWAAKKLETVCDNLSSGKSKTQSVEGKFPIYGSTGIIGWSNNFDYTGNKVLVARVGANAGTVNVVEGNYCVSDNTLMITLKSNTDLLFIFYWLINFQLNKLVFGSGQPLITGGQLKDLEIAMPKTKEEQIHIATILTDIDKEISIFEKQLSKAQNIKQGMMQQLLTGKIRLV